MEADLAPLLEAASDFASYPGLQNDASAKEFLDRFPLTFIFNVLQTVQGERGVEATIVACLDRVFKTKYGATALLQHVPFLQVGLQANSQAVRCLACKAISYILDCTEERGNVLKILIGYDIYSLLLNSLIDSNEETSAASLDAIKNIARSPGGIDIVLPPSSSGSIQLKDVAAHCSSLGRIRILALVKELFSLSDSAASAVYNANLLQLFEVEINKREDMLSTLSALEILYELVESPYSSKLLLKTTLLQILIDTMSNTSVDSILRSRAILISGRLLSTSEAYTDLEEARISLLLLAIDEKLKTLEGQNADEFESALEALGQIGTSFQGAVFLLTSSSVVRHVFESAFGRQGRGKQLAALHALGLICGVNRSNLLLNDSAEECLKRLFYATASKSAKLTPSGLLLSVLQQEPEVRLAAYRLISAAVVRPWCLMEVCSKPEIITIVTDANMEDTKIGMEARFQCCAAINNALSASMHKDSRIAEIAGKVQEAVQRGPYLTKKHIEPQPVVMTAERF